MFLGAGPTEIIFILVVALLIFGPKRLPEIAQSIGKGIGELKRASRGLQDAVQKDIIKPINEDLVEPVKSASPLNTKDDTKDDEKGDSENSG